MTPQEQLDCVLDEIRAYPQPVPEGDTQYAKLLERRAELEDAIMSEEGDGDNRGRNE